MVLEFSGDAQEKVYSAMMNNIAYQSNIGILTGCAVTEDAPASMDVIVDSGTVFFGNDNVTVAGSTETIAANSTSYTRYDLIAIDNTGTASVVQGTAAAVPVTPDYDADSYTIAAIITVTSGAATITTSAIRDIRVLNQGGSGGSGDSSIGRYIHAFSASTSETVTHNLGDDEPMVTVYDSTGQLVLADDVTITDENELVVTFSVATTGDIVVYGGVGLATSYYTEDYTAATSWSVAHNLGRQYVQIQCYDSSDEMMNPTTITAVDENNSTIDWGGVSTAGRVVVTGGSSQPGIITFKAYASSTVDNNSHFRDSADDIPKWKDDNGNIYQKPLGNVKATVFGDSPLTLDYTHDNVICNTTGGAIAITLPEAADSLGKEYLIMLETDGGTDTVVTCAGADKLNVAGNTVATLADAEDFLHIVAISADRWLIITDNGIAYS